MFHANRVTRFVLAATVELWLPSDYYGVPTELIPTDVNRQTIPLKPSVRVFPATNVLVGILIHVISRDP